MWKRKTPVELAHYVPEPIIVLFGCRPLVPFHRGWHDRPSLDQHYRAPASVVPASGRPWPAPRCPACKGAIGRRGRGKANTEFLAELDRRTYCELCSSMDPRNEANALAQRIGEQARSQHAEATRKLEHALGQAESARHRPRLSEVDRRRIWNGYKGGILAAHAEVTNRARIGREFLTRIKQEPDWSLILDARGKVIGRQTVAEHA